jgi:predicted ATP-grasp superfamily ATP-dependent carboligase
VDLVVQDNRPFVVEINPRFSASIEVLERSVADAAVAAHAACFTAPSSYDWNREIRKPVGKYILYAAQAIQIGETLAAELLEGCRSGRVADVPRAGTEIGAGEPICTILVEGVSCSAVAEGLDAFSRDLLNRLAARG